MKTYSGFVLISSLLLTACAMPRYTERLQQPMPLPEGEWTVTQSNPNDMNNVTEMRWQAVDSENYVQSFVFEQQPNSDLMKTKTIDDQQGQRNCDELFDSQILSKEPVNGYPALVWVSECKSKSGAYSKILHKSIAGKESLYVFNKVWRSLPLQTEWDLWLDYTNKIHICDINSKSQSCK
jgi:hypothetical protein